MENKADKPYANELDLIAEDLSQLELWRSQGFKRHEIRMSIGNLCNTYTQHLQRYICENQEYGGPVREAAYMNLLGRRGFCDDSIKPVDELLAQQICLYSEVPEKFSDEESDCICRVWTLAQRRADACQVELTLLDQLYATSETIIKTKPDLPNFLFFVEGVPEGTENLHRSLIEYGVAPEIEANHTPRPS